MPTGLGKQNHNLIVYAKNWSPDNSLVNSEGKTVAMK
jgi:hypothetical protein